MSNLDRERLDELETRYPSDSCRQIATYVLEDSGAPECDRVCAAGILNALVAADHAMDLTILEVNRARLLKAAHRDAALLWSKYDEDGECSQGRFPPSDPDPEEPADDGTRDRGRFRSLLHSSGDVLKRASSLSRPPDEKHHILANRQR